MFSITTWTHIIWHWRNNFFIIRKFLQINIFVSLLTWIWKGSLCYIPCKYPLFRMYFILFPFFFWNFTNSKDSMDILNSSFRHSFQYDLIKGNLRHTMTFQKWTRNFFSVLLYYNENCEGNFMIEFRSQIYIISI